MAGSLLGIMSDRGRGTIMHVDVNTLYNNVALGLLSTVSGLKTFGAHRIVFKREASSGLNKCARTRPPWPPVGSPHAAATSIVSFCLYSFDRHSGWS